MSEVNVLVVEDELLIGLEIESVLTDAGFSVIGPAATVESALKDAQTARIDCALLDANLNGKPVDAVADALVGRRVPFVFLTGYGRENLPAAHRNAPLISKPFEARALVATIRTLTGRAA